MAFTNWFQFHFIDLRVLCLFFITFYGSHEVPLNPKFNILNLHYDHCRSPMVFSWESLTCECEKPFIRENDNCICADCIFEETKHTFTQGFGNQLPAYLNEALEELDEDAVPTEDEQEESERRKRSLVEDTSPSNENKLATTYNVYFNVPNINFFMFLYMDRPPVKSENKGIDFSENRRFFSSGRFRPMPDFENNIDGIIFDDDYDQPIPPVISKPKKRLKIMKINKGRDRLEGKSLSRSVITSSTKGSINSGQNKATGAVSSYRGTGSMALAAGGGSGVSTAFTELGNSEMHSSASGSTAFGAGFIGKKALNASSTGSVLVGKGDAIAVNALSGNGLASGAAIATENAAGAATSAFGSASAAASASPGQGAVGSSSSYNEGVKSQAQVEREKGAIAESASVGNPDQDIQELRYKAIETLTHQPIPKLYEPAAFDFNDLFGIIN